MEVSRRDFLRFSVGAGGTALAGLVGSGINLGLLSHRPKSSE
jgi:hypothetical protein